MRPRLTAAAAVLVLAVCWPQAARAQSYVVNTCEAEVDGHVVTLTAQVCDAAAVPAPSNPTVKFFYDRATQPGPTESPGANFSPQAILTGANGYCATVEAPVDPLFNPLVLPNGKYNLWCIVGDTAPVAANGPNEYAVGPDLWPYAMWVEKDGDTSIYKAIVCNTGTDVARNFRVGFYYNRVPVSGQYSDAFKSVESLAPYDPEWWWHPNWACKEVEYRRTTTPNGTYSSYVKVDDGEFVLEADETNNVYGPYGYTMSNADLVIERFDATVSDAAPWRVEYDVRVCNRGSATAGVFWIDLYYDRDQEDAPQIGNPGDQNYGWPSLPPDACVDHTFVWEGSDLLPTGPNKPKYESWVQADADEFVYDPDRSTNLEGPLNITVPGGVVVTGCPDADGDGYGIGPDCVGGIEDCDDNDPATHPGAEEICDDGIDQNCNQTPDDGCDGIDCQDADGDGWPSGPDCVLADCDDDDPALHPFAEEICGDGIDQDCDGIPDDCCEGVSCCDMDGDGYGVGAGCPDGQQDCDDNNPAAGSDTTEEVCYDNQDNDCDGLVDENCPGSYCEDLDNDGYGVGEGCTGIQDPDDNDPNVPGGGEICGDGIDNDGNGIPDDMCDTCVDLDGDGYYVGNGDDPSCQGAPKDCDDTDNTVNPGAAEVCDLIDNNCNYTVDEGTPGNLCPDPQCVSACGDDTACVADCPDLNCVDGDGDGWGTGSGCEVQDCDDNDPNLNPGQQETCGDNQDDDCDETPDDGCPGVDCVDSDGDGWGVGADCVIQDPDDNDAAVWPGAPEICGDGIDQSGDGVPDDGCVLCVDHDGDGYGVGPFCSVRDCNDDDPNVHPGAAEDCDTGDRNCDGLAPISSKCGGCGCAQGGSSPRGRWPEATGLLLLLVWVIRRKRV